MYSDPAVNLLLGHGFTSSAWYAQASDEFWAGNVPLHSALLFLWLKLFGFSITAVRSLNFVCFAAACLLAWRTSARLGLIVTARARLLFLFLLLGGYSVIFSYRSGRPDVLAMLVVAGLFFAQSLAKHWRRGATYLALGIAAPWVGLQLLPLLGVGGLLSLLFAGRRMFPRLVAVGLGAIAGLGSLVAFCKSNGVWEQFLRSTGQHTGVGFLGLLAGGHLRHSNLLPKDFSFWPVFALAVALAVFLVTKRHFRWRSPLSFGLVYAVVLSLALVLTGKFPTYYGWMTYAPLCLCVCATLSQTKLPAVVRLAGGTLLIAAVGAGLGLHAAAALSDWSDRAYRPVESFVRRTLAHDDWVLGEHGVYYAAKPFVARLLLPYHLPAMRDEEKRRLTALVLAPAMLGETTNAIGGNWISTGARIKPRRRGLFGTDWKYGFLSMPNYELEVYRRAEPRP